MGSNIPNLARRKITLAVGLCLPVWTVQAQQPEVEDGHAELSALVVTASAAGSDIKDAPASISVLTAEDIKKIPATDLNEVLRRVPGLSQGSTPDGGTSIQIRGLPQQYTLVLVDGKRTGSSSETFDRYTRNELNWIPVESIERIEVVRGPMSSLYGSDAMGGVINIITKKNEPKWSGSITGGAEVNEDSIRGNDYTGSFSLGGPLAAGLGLRLNGQQSYRQADRELPSGTTAFRWAGGREGSKLRSLGGTLSWEINPDHQLDFDYQKGEWRTLAAPEGDTSNPGGFLTSSFTRGPAKMERENIGIHYTGEYALGTSKLSLTQVEYKNDTTAPVIRNGQLVPKDPPDRRDPYLSYASKAVAKDLIADGSFSAPLSLGLEQLLTVGAQWQRSELDNPNSVGALPNVNGVVGLSFKKVNSKAFFAEDQIYLKDNLTLTLGARSDHHDDYGSRLSPRAYLVYHPTNNWTLRGGYSEGFRAPTLRQSNPNFVSESQGAGCSTGYQGGGCFTRGNDSLKPEISKNWEFGVAWDSSLLEAGLTFFTTDFKNKIDSRGLGYLPGSSAYWQEYVNIASAVTRGFEASLRVPLLQGAVVWDSNVTHMLKAQNKDSGEPLSATPRWAATSSLDWQFNDALSFNLLGEFTGKQVHLGWRQANHGDRFGDQRIEKSYAIYDAGLAYRLNDRLRLSGGVKNIFDRDVNGDIDRGNNFYVPGRRYFTSLTMSF